MIDSKYEDDECTYCGADPRFADDMQKGRRTLTKNEVRFQGVRDSISWPRRAIVDVAYSPTFPVDLEAIARTSGIDAAQDIAVGLAEDCVPEPSLSIHIEDR